jgi:hypothetical protein
MGGRVAKTARWSGNWLGCGGDSDTGVKITEFRQFLEIFSLYRMKDWISRLS